MSARTQASFLVEKVSGASLFRIYRQAFELAYGSRLRLCESVPEGEQGLPVPVGRTVPFFLVAESVGEDEDRLIRGLLRSFALQLGDEVNQAVLEITDPIPEVTGRAIHYVREHLGERLSLNVVAEALGLCSFQLCRLFKKGTGITITEYIRRLRVDRAQKRLKNLQRPIADIAIEVGFRTISQFNRSFLRYSGESPSEYRARLGELEHCELEVA